MERRWWGVLIAGAVLLTSAASAQSTSEGTLGMNVVQTYDDTASNKRGDLVVVDVDGKYPAAKAGLKPGDIIFELDGKPVKNRDVMDIAHTDLHGAPGGTVRIKAYRPSTGMPVEFSLVRSEYLPIETAPADPFYFVTPGNWHAERHVFPLEWAPDLGYKGVEDIRFSPNFGNDKSSEYFTYFFVWWIEGRSKLQASELENGLLKYYKGLSAGFAEQSKFPADLAKVSADLNPENGGTEFRGKTSTYDGSGKLLSLNTEILIRPCGEHTAVLFSLSPTEFGAAVWKNVHAIRDTFKCSKLVPAK